MSHHHSATGGGEFADKRRGIITFVRTLRVCRALLCEKWVLLREL